MLFKFSNDNGEPVVCALSKNNFNAYLESRNNKEVTFTELKEALVIVMNEDESLFQRIKDEM